MFNNYQDVLVFIIKVGGLAEAQQHHPRIVNDLGKDTVYWWTHKLGGLHRNDFIMAAKTNDIVSG
jgi:4a-hydroxytetrahydrobiopterin dehydratase